MEHRSDLVVADMSAFCLDKIADTIDDRATATGRANFTSFVENFVRAIQQLARDRNQPSTTTDDARGALALVTEFTYRQRPEIPRQIPRSQSGNRRERLRPRSGRPTR